MGNKILVIQALEEKAQLEKRIREKIKNVSFVDIVRHNGDIVWNNGTSKLRYCQEAESAYSEITALIERYLQLTASIAESNAHTSIQTSYGTFSVAAALTLRSHLRECSYYEDETRDFGIQLYDSMMAEYNHCLIMIGEINRTMQKDDKSSGAFLAEQGFVHREIWGAQEEPAGEDFAELVDPLNIRKRMGEFMNRRSRFLSELDIAIKVSNAVSFISLGNGSGPAKIF